MTIRAKSRRRLLLLLLVVVAVGGGGTAWYLHRERARDQEARSAREAGLAAWGRGENEEAIRLLAQFIRRLDPDALALLRYAQAILERPQVDSRYLGAAVASLRRCVHLEPENVEARRALLELYVEQGVRAEALEQAEWFLARDGTDRQALLAKAQTLLRMRRFEEALAALDAQVPPASPRLEEQLLYVTLLAVLEKPRKEVLDRAAAVEAACASEPRFRLVGVHARLLTEAEVPRARETLRALVADVAGDAEFARLALPDLDAARLPREALDLLRSLSPRDLDAALQVQLVRRLWEAGEGEQVPRRVEDWGHDAATLPTPVLGYHALALSRMGMREDAARTLAILEGRSGQEDLAAKAWATWIRGAVLPDAPGIRARIDACLEASDLDPANAQVRFELGLAYRDAEESELALRELQEAGTLSRTWSAPRAVASGILMKSGRLADAIRAARSADALDSRDPGVKLLLAMARGAASSEAGGSFADRVLDSLERSELPAMRIAELKLAMLPAAGRLDEARRLIEEVLRPGESPPGDLLLGCASLSREIAPELKARALSRYEELHGTTPALALALARDAADAGGPPAGLGVFRERRARAKDGTPVAWQVAEARYLQAYGLHEQALEAWQAAIQQDAENIAALHQVLASDSAWRDRAFVRSIVRALRAATGDSGLAWRLHDAQWILSDPAPAPADLDEATGHLKAIVDVAPEHTRARRLLAEAYERSGQTQAALDQLVIARAALRRPGMLDLQIARLYQRVGQVTAARDVLNRVLASRPSTTDELLALAGLFARLGDRKAVVDLLEQLDEEELDLDEGQRQADLYAAVGALDRAERRIRSVLAERESPRALLLAAALVEFRGGREEADALLARLDALVADPLERERMLAEHFRRVGRLDRAEEVLLRVVGRPAATPADWRALLAVLLLRDEPVALAQALERARGQGVFSAEGDPAPSADLLRAAAERGSLRGLGLAYLEDASHRSVAEEALRTVAADPGDGLAQETVGRLRSLAKATPAFLPLQLAAIDALIHTGAAEEALGLCQRAADRFPAEPEPARALAYCQRVLNRPEQAAAAARQWRARTLGAPLGPDLFLAEQSAPGEVVSRLEPYVGTALRRGDARVLLPYGEALIRSGKPETVEALLGPALAGEPALIPTWIQLARVAATHGQPALAARWLEHEALRRASDAQARVRVELVAAWQAVARASGAEAHRARFQEVLALALRDEHLLAPSDWAMLGQVHEADDDAGRAEAAYRRAIEADPTLLVAGNNLAMILARSGRAREALPLAQRVVALARGRVPGVAQQARLRDTLAFVQVEAGDAPSALQQLDRCRELEPANAHWACRILQVLRDQGDEDAARARLARFRGQYPEERMDPAVRAAWTELRRALE